MEKLSANIVRTADVIGKKIIGINQESIGKVEELVLDKQKGNVRYAVLAHGGFMGLGNELYAIPWSILEYSPEDGAFKVNITQEDIEKSPGFNKDAWPDFADPTWDKSNSDFYNQLLTPHSPFIDEQKDFLSQGTDNKTLNKDI